jgi:cyd operon protein YbgT
MWYFTWILGLLLACSLGIINVLRLEAQETWDREHIPVDPLTQLMTKDTMLGRLKEKVENS